MSQQCNISMMCNENASISSEQNRGHPEYSYEKEKGEIKMSRGNLVSNTWKYFYNHH